MYVTVTHAHTHTQPYSSARKQNIIEAQTFSEIKLKDFFPFVPIGHYEMT